MMPTKDPFGLPSEQLRNAYYALTKSTYYELQPLTKTTACLLKTGTLIHVVKLHRKRHLLIPLTSIYGRFPLNKSAYYVQSAAGVISNDPKNTNTNQE